MINCPFCGCEIDPYQGLEPDDVEEFVTQEMTHSLDWEWECDGCERWSNQYYVAHCDNCDHEFDVLETYVQPCNANGYAVYRQAYKQAPNDIYRTHLHKPSAK